MKKLKNTFCAALSLILLLGIVFGGGFNNAMAADSEDEYNGEYAMIKFSENNVNPYFKKPTDIEKDPDLLLGCDPYVYENWLPEVITYKDGTATFETDGEATQQAQMGYLVDPQRAKTAFALAKDPVNGHNILHMSITNHEAWHGTKEEKSSIEVEVSLHDKTYTSKNEGPSVIGDGFARVKVWVAIGESKTFMFDLTDIEAKDLYFVRLNIMNWSGSKFRNAKVSFSPITVSGSPAPTTTKITEPIDNKEAKKIYNLYSALPEGSKKFKKAYYYTPKQYITLEDFLRAYRSSSDTTQQYVADKYKITNDDYGKLYFMHEDMAPITKVICKQAKISSAPFINANTIKLKWAKTVNAVGYQVYQEKSKKFERIVTVKNGDLFYEVKGLKAGKKYSFKIRAYVKDEKGNVTYGKFSSVKSVTTLSKAKPTLSLTPSSKSIKLTWSSVAGASGYEVYLKEGKTFKRIKTITSGSKLSYNKSSLKKGQSCTFKVRAYKNASKGKVFGTYSSEKKSKAK